MSGYVIVDYASKRVGSPHAEYTRSGRSYCPTCGFVDALDPNSASMREWHGDALGEDVCSECGSLGSQVCAPTCRTQRQPDEEVFPLEDWRYEVANGDTRLGYSEWAAHKAESEAT